MLETGYKKRIYLLETGYFKRINFLNTGYNNESIYFLETGYEGSDEDFQTPSPSDSTLGDLESMLKVVL